MEKMSYLERIDKYLDSLKVGKSAIVDSWFMMSSPGPIFSVVAAYLIWVRIGPRIMKNRPPLNIHNLIMYYNVAQIAFSLVICMKSLNLNLFKDGFFYAGCRYPSNTLNLQLLDLGWWYFFAKLTELLDTVFFIFRKKDSQVTFLHVYHHAIMALYSWSYLKYAAGGQGALMALLNSSVHVVMYTYYFLSGLGPKFQKYIWWKKYVTSMQLIQFVMMLVYCIWTHFSPRCQYAHGFTYFISSNVLIFLFLFLKFYSKNYKYSKDAKKLDYKKSHNGVTKNGINGKMLPELDLDGKKRNKISDVDTKTGADDGYETQMAGGDYNNCDMFLTRRTAKASSKPQCDLSNGIKK